MNRTLRLAARTMLCATALAGTSCVDNPQSVYIAGFLNILKDNGCKATVDGTEFRLLGLADPGIIKYSSVGYLAAPLVRNNLINTSTSTAIQRNTIFPTAIEVEIVASPGKKLPPIVGLGSKFSTQLPFPAVDPGGKDVATLELIPKGIILAAANNLGAAEWDDTLVARTRIVYTHNNETKFTPTMDFPVRVVAGALGSPDQPCPVGGFQSNQVQTACFPGQDDPITCCTQGAQVICGAGVPVNTGGSGADAGI